MNGARGGIALVRMVRLQRRERARRGTGLSVGLRSTTWPAAGTLAYVSRVAPPRGSRRSSAPASGASRGSAPSPRRRGREPVSALLIGTAGVRSVTAVMMKAGSDMTTPYRRGWASIVWRSARSWRRLFATKVGHPPGRRPLLRKPEARLAIQAWRRGRAGLSSVVTYALLKALDKFMGSRLGDETMGLDLSEHGEAGYTW